MKQKNIIGIVDFQAGNITSLRNSISFLGYKSLLVKKPNDIKKFSKIILPGVGSFDTAMKNLKKNKIDQELRNYVKKKSNKLLGICLGMQLLFEKSEETNNDEKFVQGLSIIKGSVESFSTQRKKRETALAIVSSIKLTKGENPIASEGQLDMQIGWDIDQWERVPTAFRLERT